MALTRTFLGAHPDTGAPYYNYTEDDPTKAVLITGPASGTLTMADGTEYAVDADAVSVDPQHIDEIHHHIEVQHEQTGVLDVPAEHSPTGEPVTFRHKSCGHCEKGGK